MKRRGVVLKITAIAILFSLVFASAVEAFFTNNSEKKETKYYQKEILASPLGDRDIGIWEDTFSDETKIDPNPPGDGISENYVVSGGFAEMANTYSVWTDPSFTRMKHVTLTNNEGSIIYNYKLNLVIAYDTDMQSDYDDIRFKHENNPSTWLDYWIETSDTTEANVWVEIPIVPIGTSKLYLFYGNPSASSQSDFSDVFSDWNEKWSTDEKITNHLAKEGTWDPDVCFGNGEFIVAWEEGQYKLLPYTLGFKQEIRGSMYSPTGSKLVDDKEIYNPGTTYYRNENPSIAYDDDGSFFVAWEHYDNVADPTPSTMDILGRTVERNINDFSLGSVKTICSASLCQADPNVVYNSINNKFVIAWEDARAGGSPPDYDIYANTFNPATGAVGTEVTIISDSSYSYTEPWIAFDSINNRYMVVFERGENPADGPFDIMMGLFDSTLTQMGSYVVVAEGDTNLDYNFPCVEFCEDAEVYLVTWNSGDISDNDWWGDVYGKIYDTSGNLEVDTFTISSGDYVRTDIVNYKFDTFLVSYDDGHSGGTRNIWGKLVSTTGDILSNAIQFSADTDAEADWANMGVGNGKIFVAWEDTREVYASPWNTNPDVFGNIWELAVPDGSEVSYVIGSELEIVLTSYITSVAITPSDLKNWDRFFAVYSGSVTFDILDGVTGSHIQSVSSGHYLSSLSATSIRLMATFSRSNPTSSPTLDKYNVSWTTNSPPNVPSNPSPGDGEIDVDLDADLSWSCSDPDGDDLTYDVYFGTSSTPPLVSSNQTATTYEPGTLNFGTTYHWKIVAEDEYGATTNGPLWDFTTEVNNPPNTPSNPSPVNGATNVGLDADISWSGGDPDGDYVVYDVYFGTSSNPPKIVSNQSSTSYDPGTMIHNTIYYWKIKAWDEHGASTIGPLWSFTTKINNPPNTPSSPSPANGAINVDLNADLSWSCSDPDGDDLTYDVYFGTSTPPPLVSSSQTATIYDPGTMDHGTIYYWRIKAIDEYGAFTLGSIWSFTTEANDPPNTPSNPDPYDGETDVDLNADLSWTGGDPNGDTVTYDVYFGTSSPPPKVVSNQSSTSYDPGTMGYGTTYYWRIKAIDEYGASTLGPIWDFTTEVNNPPNTPSNPSPANGATGVSLDADLSWTCSDPDGDDLTYDVYFDTVNPPTTMVSSGQTANTYNPGTMALCTTYYWKIVAEDEHGATTTGPVWSFTTRCNNAPNIPSNPDPSDGETDVGLDQIISWTGGDPDGDDVTYDVFFGETNPPPQVSWGQDETTYDPELDFLTLYYWKIVAEDEFGEITHGPIWSFTTEGNNPPNTPYNPSPYNGEVDVLLDSDLSWSGGDPDPGDTVTYDIYFGDTTPPPLVKLDHATTVYDVGMMAPLTTYYWKIIARDSIGAETQGPIWQFTTGEEANFPPLAPTIRSLDHPSGLIIINPGVNYKFEVRSTDPDNDDIYYYVDWGDGVIEDYNESYTSGEAVLFTHTWAPGITYNYIYVKAKDENGAESGWGKLFYIVPKQKDTHSRSVVLLPRLNRLVNRFIDSHPKIEALIYKIFENILTKYLDSDSPAPHTVLTKV